MTRNARLTLYIGGIVALASFLLIYASFDPAHNPFPRCIFLSLSGLKCPGCGSQRALHALMHGNLAQAWHYNSILILSLPLLALLGFGSLYKNRYPRLYNRLNGSTVIWTVFAITIGWWILRNIFDW
ncbi:MAG: DUF2752 domain-containing protein [Paramuribaculum sp.]|nr:DUF2752 domain-containing protein [Paramuribaculum sp.]MDE6652617.1 DUF2752 domain-containing protein [Paramuribaculum sp.]